MLKSVLLKNQYILTVARLPKITLIGTKWPYSPRNFFRLKQEYQVEKPIESQKLYWILSDSVDKIRLN